MSNSIFVYFVLSRVYPVRAFDAHLFSFDSVGPDDLALFLIVQNDWLNSVRAPSYDLKLNVHELVFSSDFLTVS